MERDESRVRLRVASGPPGVLVMCFKSTCCGRRWDLVLALLISGLQPHFLAKRPQQPSADPMHSDVAITSS